MDGEHQFFHYLISFLCVWDHKYCMLQNEVMLSLCGKVHRKISYAVVLETRNSNIFTV